MKCPKNYTIPTNKWLEPLKVLFDDNSLIMESILTDMISKEKVVAKITKIPDINTIKSNLNIKNIYEIIKASPHIATIYCFLTCKENKTNLINKYKDILGFCTLETQSVSNLGEKSSALPRTHDTNDDNLANVRNITINIEIMKKYKNTLRRYTNKLSTENVKNIMRYLLNMQIELFRLYGFIHRDIHLGNIFIEKTEPYKLKFKTSCNTDIVIVKLITPFKLYLTDFEYSKILLKSLNPEIKELLSQREKLTFEYTLESQIYQTVYMCLDLLEDIGLQDKLHKLLPTMRSEYIPIKILNSYAKGNKTEETFIALSSSAACTTCNDIFKLFFNEHFNL
jgi:serine/threonine protein kinase